MLVHPSYPDCFLIDPVELHLDDQPEIVRQNRGVLDEIMRWVHTFLTSPHPDLGRDGNVCPFVKPSMDRGQFWLALYLKEHIEMQEVCKTVMHYRDWFLEMEPREKKDAQYKTIVLIFPHITAGQEPSAGEAQTCICQRGIDDRRVLCDMRKARVME